MSSDDTGIFGRPDDSSRRRGSGGGGLEAENSMPSLTDPRLSRPPRKSAGDHLSEGNLGGALAEGLRSLFTDK